jgi:hypothetical protein
VDFFWGEAAILFSPATWLFIRSMFLQQFHDIGIPNEIALSEKNGLPVRCLYISFRPFL